MEKESGVFDDRYHTTGSAPSYINTAYVKDDDFVPTPLCGNEADLEKSAYNDDPAKQEKHGGFLTLFKYVYGIDYLFLAVGLVASIGLGCGMPGLIILFGNLVDEMIVPEREGFQNQTDGYSAFDDEIVDVCLQITYVGIAIFVIAYIQIATITLFGENVLYRIRKESFRSVLRQDIAWFDYQQTGKLVSKLAENLETIRIGVSDKIAIVVQHLSTFIAGFIIAFVYNVKLAGVISVLIPLFVIAGVGLSKLAESASSTEQEDYGESGTIAEATLSSIRTVVAFGGQTRAIQSYNKNLRRARFQMILKTTLTGAFLAFFFMVEFMGYGLAFWYGPKLIVDGEIEAGELMIVFFSVITGAMSLGQGITAYFAVSGVGSALAFITSIIYRKPIIDADSDEGEKLGDIKGKIEIKDLKFSYPTRKDIQVLKSLSLVAEPGQKIALVGASGSGKSTVVNLIQRFYEYSTGTIHLDGVDLKCLNVKWLREQIGVVSQEPVLFACSIRENIKYGADDVTDQQVEDAIALANAKEFIAKLPQRLDTVVGDRGCQLSGGQKQRIAIARALVRNPKILLLDEATSALDSSSESIVQEALDKACAGRTTLVVAHRLSTIKDSNLIIAMEHGKVIETGTHAQLLVKNGHYANLVRAQTLNEIESSQDNVGTDEASERDSGVLDIDGDASAVHIDKAHETVQFRDGHLAATQETVTNSPSKKKKDKKKKQQQEQASFVDIMKLNAPEWYFMLLGCLFAIPAAGGMPVYGIFFAELIEVFALPNDEMQDEANFWALMFVVLGLVVGLAHFFESLFLGISGARLTSRLRERSFESILRQDMSFFDKEENYVGNLTTKLAREAAQVQGASGFRLKALVEAIVGLSTGVVIAFIFGWQLALVILAMLPIIGVAAGIQLKFASGFSVSGDESKTSDGQIVSESISSIKTVQSLNLEKRFSDRFNHTLYLTHKKNLCMAHVFGFAQAVAQSMFYFVFAGTFRFAAWLISKDELSSPDAFRVIFSLVFAAFGVGQSMSLVPDYDAAKRAAFSIIKLLSVTPAIDNLKRSGEKLKEEIEEIVFEDVHFHYPSRPGIKILRGINLKVKRGTTVALVGPSGCGKSTVMQLLLRFYDVEKGSVLINGKNIKSLDLQHLRRKMAIVSQEPTLFNDSIRNNILYGDMLENGRVNPSVTTNHITKAASKANVAKFVDSLPNGYETTVGDKGTQLSGGQKQRVAIARALLRDPEILLLDEATSALDSESERIVQAALDEARVGRTCLVIAHRLTTIQSADEIVVVDQGQVVEKGTHDQLISSGGLYKQFCEAQSLS